MKSLTRECRCQFGFLIRCPVSAFRNLSRFRRVYLAISIHNDQHKIFTWKKKNPDNTCIDTLTMMFLHGGIWLLLLHWIHAIINLVYRFEKKLNQLKLMYIFKISLKLLLIETDIFNTVSSLLARSIFT